MVYYPGHQAVTQFVKPVSQVVKVDHVIPGCRANIEVALTGFTESLQIFKT